jgi:hypothetical protein
MRVVLITVSAVLFAATGLAQNVGVGVASPQERLDVSGRLRLSSNNTAGAPTGGAGTIRWNATVNAFQGYVGAPVNDWVSFGSPAGLLSQTLPSGQVFVGNASNIATGVALSGDAAITNAGVLTIGTGAVTTGKILNGTILDEDVNASAAIARTKLASGTANALVVNNGSGVMTGLAPGANGNILTSDGTQWQSANPGTLFIRNQNAATQPTSDFWISGTGRAGTSFQSPVYTRADAGTVSIRPNTDAVTAIQLQNAAGTSILNVDATNQRVGIGTVAPEERLQVDGNVLLSRGGTKTLRVQSANAGNQGDTLRVVSGSAASTGGARSGGSLLLEAGNAYTHTDNTVRGGNLVLRSGGNRYPNPSQGSQWGDIVFESARNVSSSSNSSSVERMRIQGPSGNVGINVAAPTQRLDIDGQVRIRGGVPGAGKVLTSDANGVGAWTDPTVGTVTNVTGTAPIAVANNTVAPVISLNDLGVTTAKVANNAVTNDKLRQSAGFSVIGRSGTGTGNVADIVAGTNGVLRRDGAGDLGFGTLVTGNIGDAQITNAKLADNAVTNAKVSDVAWGKITGAPSFITGNQTITLSGDVTGSGTTAITATIANDAVTSAKIADGTIVNADIANGTINLTQKVTGVLPIANGGTNSSTTLNNNRVMVSSGGAIVENAALTANLPVYATASGLTTTAPNDGVQGYWTRDNTNSRLYNTTLGDNVGIGVAAPNHALQVSRDVTIPQLSLYNPGNATDKIAGMRMGTESGWNIQLRTQQDKDWLQLADASGTTVTQSWNGVRYYPGSSSSNNVNTGYISGDGTNIGIGTETPVNKLQVNGNGRFGTSGNNYVYLGSGATTGNGGLEIFTSSNVAFIRYHDPAVAWRDLALNDAGGNVGVGTSGPAEKLDVTGSIRASSIVYWGANGGRTESRDNAGLQGDAGAKSGFFETESPANYYSGASSWQHLLDVRHNNPANNYAMQFAGSFFDQRLFFRKTNNNAAQAWREIDAQVGFMAKKNAAVSQGHATWLVHLFGEVDFNDGSGYDVSNGRFTVPAGQAGVYQFNAHVLSHTSTDRDPRAILSFWVNGAERARVVDDRFNNATWRMRGLNGSVTLKLNPGDYVEVRTYWETNNNSGVTWNSAGVEGHFSGHKVYGTN